jgi:hypothetical protein
VIKLYFLLTRGWKLIPRRHRRQAMITAAMLAKTHGPKAARLAREHGPKIADAASRARAAVRKPPR